MTGQDFYERFHLQSPLDGFPDFVHEHVTAGLRTISYGADSELLQIPGVKFIDPQEFLLWVHSALGNAYLDGFERGQSDLAVQGQK